MSVVRRPSSVNFCFKQLLLLNRLAKVDETWQGCSLHEALLSLRKKLIPCNTLVAMATKRKIFKKSSSQESEDLQLRYLVCSNV